MRLEYYRNKLNHLKKFSENLTMYYNQCFTPNNNRLQKHMDRTQADKVL